MTPFPSLGPSIISSQNAAVFFSFFSSFLFSTLTRVNLHAEREREREREREMGVVQAVMTVLIIGLLFIKNLGGAGWGEDG